MDVSDVVGNSLAITTLKKLVQESRVPHALLFSGPSGIGKKKLALSLAKAVLGSNSAVKIDKGIHPDVRVFTPEGKSQIHPISSIENIISMIALKPYEANARFIIIDDAEKMLAASSNALLKTLEEPQANNYFVLITAHPENILSTIASRCSSVPFFPIAAQHISSCLIDKYAVEPLLASRSSHLSGGSFVRAYTIATSPSLGIREEVLAVLSNPQRQMEAVKGHIDAIDDKFSALAADEENPALFFEESERMIEEVLYWYRDVQALQAGCCKTLLYHQDVFEELKRAAQAWNPSYEKVVTITDECRLAIHRSIKIKHTIEYLFSRLWALC